MNRNANMLGILLAVICVVAVITIVVAVFYLLTLQKALNRCSPRNRLMEPALVWLSLVPFVHIVWPFFIAVRVPGSLRNEFRDRRQDDGSDYGQAIALSSAVIGVISMVLVGMAFAVTGLDNIGDPPPAASVIDLANNFLGLVNLILFITFWVKIAGYSAKLADGYHDVERRLRQFDDEDDYGRDYRGDRGRRGPDDDAGFREGEPDYR